MNECGNCGAVAAGVSGQYDAFGALVCRACAAGERVASPDRAATIALAQAPQQGDVIYGSMGSLLLALLSFMASVMIFDFVLPIIAFGGGALTLYQALYDPKIASALDWKRVPSLVASGLAMLLSVISLWV